ncbi:hypothetical protein DRJ71_16865, partial [Enterococcus faecalis]
MNGVREAEQSTYQVDKSKTYFDLSLPANESVPLVIHVTNNSEEAIEVAGGITLRDVAEEKTS